MIRRKAARAADTIVGALLLVRLHVLFRVGGRRAVARRTAAAMRGHPSTQAELDACGVDPWHTGRAVWRAKRFLPLRSSCLQTALATHMLFARKHCTAVVRIGVRGPGEDAHAWVEIGDFVLDDQRISSRFAAFTPRPEVRL